MRALSPDAVMDPWLSCWRPAARVWRRRPVLSGAIIFTLGTAIALSVTMSTILMAVAARASHFPRGSQVVQFQDAAPDAGSSGETVPVTAYAQWRASSPLYHQLAAYRTADLLVAADGAGQTGTVTTVFGDLFEALGISPRYGRVLGRPDEESAPCHAVLVERLAQTLYGSPAAAIGRSVRFEQDSCRVVGVVADDQAFPTTETVAFVAAAPRARVRRDANGRVGASVAQVRVLGRPRPEVPHDQLRSEAAQHFTHEARLVPLQDALTISYQRTLEVLQLASLAVVIVAAVNVSALLAAGIVQRLRSWVVKGILGASRQTVWREALAESAALCVPGFLLGVGAAFFSLTNVREFGPPELATLELGVGTLGVWAVLCVGLCVVSALPAVWHTSRAALGRGAALGLSGASAGHTTTAGRRLMPLLLVLQVSVSITLVAVTLLFARTLHQTLTADRGFDADDVVVLPTYRAPDTNVAAYVERVDALHRTLAATPPALTSFALELPVPHVARPFSLQGEREGRGSVVFGPEFAYRLAVVGPQYFQVFRTPVLGGRDFQPDDRRGAALVVVASRRFAERQFGSVDGAVGAPVDVGSLLPGKATVVGVVADVTRSPWEDASLPVLYVAAPQVDLDSVLDRTQAMSRFVLLVRGAGLETVRRLRDDASHGVTFGEVWTVRQARLQEVSTLILYAAVTVAFAVTTLTLIALGVFAITAQHVQSRHDEIAIRQAIGATPREAAYAIWTSVAGWWGAAVVLGGIGSFVAARVLAYWQGPWLASWSPILLGFSVMIVNLAMILALAGPVRRTLNVEPASLLRTH